MEHAIINLKNKDMRVSELYNLLSDFVKEICKDRDSSHGYEHMVIVTKHSMDILAQECPKDEYYSGKLITVMIVAMLHDVADHKYDKNGTLQLQVRDFLETFHCDPDKIIKIINYISYSTEKKAIDANKPINFELELGDVDAIARHIVSDADKCEALGKNGFNRCVEYTKHAYKQKHNGDIPHDELKREVIQHANDKLLRLKDDFIRTKAGKDMAEIQHLKFVRELDFFSSK